jgi:hypothetical protein
MRRCSFSNARSSGPGASSSTCRNSSSSSSTPVCSPGRRCRRQSSLRIRQCARRRSHGRKLPCSGSKPAAPRQMARKTSWTSSSAAVHNCSRIPQVPPVSRSKCTIMLAWSRSPKPCNTAWAWCSLPTGELLSSPRRASRYNRTVLAAGPIVRQSARIRAAGASGACAGHPPEPGTRRTKADGSTPTEGNRPTSLNGDRRPTYDAPQILFGQRRRSWMVQLCKRVLTGTFQI